MKDYYFPKFSGDYRWHIQQKCRLAIGQTPIAIMDTSDDKTMLRFNPDLSTADENTLRTVTFPDETTASDMPAQVAGETYMIKDIWHSEWRADLGTALGCEVILWFPKSAPEVERPDRIAITFSKVLGVQEKKDAENAFLQLILGWV
jgi:hypothetical protein